MFFIEWKDKCDKASDEIGNMILKAEWGNTSKEGTSLLYDVFGFVIGMYISTL